MRTTRDLAAGGHEAPRRPSAGQRWAVPRVGQPFCKACLQTPWPVARAVEGGSTHRFVATRTDSWAYGYFRLLTFAQTQTQKKKANRVHPLRPVLAPTGRAKPKIPCTLSNYSLLQLRKKVRA